MAKKKKSPMLYEMDPYLAPFRAKIDERHARYAALRD